LLKTMFNGHDEAWPSKCAGWEGRLLADSSNIPRKF
jgi:hypothetical protein